MKLFSKQRCCDSLTEDLLHVIDIQEGEDAARHVTLATLGLEHLLQRKGVPTYDEAARMNANRAPMCAHATMVDALLQQI